MNEETFPIPYFFNIQTQAELPRTVFPTKCLRVADRTNFIQKSTTGSSMLPHDFDHSDGGRQYIWTF